MTASSLPILPVTCLSTAEDLSTREAFHGQNTVIGASQHSCLLSFLAIVSLIVLTFDIFIHINIDFWTTKCTRCPDALDKLNDMAKDPKYSNVRFVSICCDQLDGAREIIEAPSTPRWNNVSHYYMNQENKEKAKKALGFKSVPYYVILNEDGQMTQKGSSKQVDFDEIPGIVHPDNDKENVQQESVVKAVDDDKARGVAQNVNIVEEETPVVTAERVFTLDDLDF
jgi:thiol-disulfide isomerase/thioredoxin